MSRSVGIESIGIQLPSHAFDVEELAKIHGVPGDKFTAGLGCAQMALCLGDETVVDLAVGAARRALSRWGGDVSQIGLLALGTETGMDEARPLSAWVAEALRLKGSFRSYEVKHACYAGTLAVRQAMEWYLSGVARPGQVALVIAADVCLYPFLHPAEATQGAGGVALIIGAPEMCHLSPRSFPYTEPIYDFRRPIGAAFPVIQGKQSVDAYCRALSHCVLSYVQSEGREALLKLDRFSCHVPFPRMVTKALAFLSEKLGLQPEEAQRFLQKVTPDFQWTQKIGNAYNASLWIAFAKALGELSAGQRIGLFSFGSGCGAEFMDAEVTRQHPAGWLEDVQEDFDRRTMLSLEAYKAFRQSME